MKRLYDYVDFVSLFSITDTETAKKNWFGFKVTADGVWLVPPDDEMYRTFTADELSGKNDFMADLEQSVVKKTVPDDSGGPAVETYPRSEVAYMAHYKGQSEFAGLFTKHVREHGHKKPLLCFPCSEPELRTFIIITSLGFMLPPDHELLRGVEYQGWKEIISAWGGYGQKVVTPKQMKNYREQGLKIKYIKVAGKNKPVVTDADMRDFISQREKQ